jgi:hypothetical protein
MQNRFIFYGLILVITYLGAIVWKQQEETSYLKEVILEQDEAITQQKELIEVQIHYIDILAPEYYSPLNKGNNFNRPI